MNPKSTTPIDTDPATACDVDAWFGNAAAAELAFREQVAVLRRHIETEDVDDGATSFTIRHCALGHRYHILCDPRQATCRRLAGAIDHPRWTRVARRWEQKGRSP